MVIGLLAALPAGVCAEAAAPHLDAWLGAGVTGFDYEEFDRGASLDREEGVLPGITAGLRFVRHTLFAESTLDAASGRADYRAAGVATRTDEDLVDWDAVAGREFSGRGGNRISLYAGLGHRRWRRDIRSTATASGLDETYRWWYGILGLRGARGLGEHARVRADLQLTRTLDPSVRVRFAAGYDDITLDPGEERGVRAAVTFENRIDNGLVVFVSPWFEYWELGRSTDAVLTQKGLPAGTVFEPRSETRNLGIHAGVRWRLF
jgi:hypothetical protein